MKIKRLIALLSALCVAAVSAASVFAQPETEEYQQTQASAATSASVSEPLETEPLYTQQTENPQSVTAPPETTVGTEIFTQDTPTLEPTKVSLEVGEIENLRFKVKLNISPKILFSGATINVEYDSDLLELKGSEINESAIGGIPVDSSADGKYTFTYMNTAGTQYDGTYSTLTFRIKDKTMTSCVIYVSVESLEDINLLPIANVIQNGIVTYRSAEPADAEADPDSFIQIKLDRSDEPTALEYLGITDIEEAAVSDNQIAFVENGEIKTLQAGQTDLIITHSDGTKSYYRVLVSEPQESSSSDTAVKKKAELPKEKNSGRTAVIIGLVIVGIAAIAAEYIIIVKPFDKFKAPVPRIYEQDMNDAEYEDYNEPDSEVPENDDADERKE
ncbi:hypothetical protein Osc1_08760 [Hominimerdicola sp. 21CYCFAH17_S]